MSRLLFEKTGSAVWISHLDLMRLFQRAFKRAGLALKHTQGFNPRPSVSIALPLSVGVESCCELLDFDIDGDKIANDEICKRLNEALVSGVQVRKVYEGGKKLKELTHLRCIVTLEYDNGVPAGAVQSIERLLHSDSLLVSKKSKNGPVEQDIIPMMKACMATQTNSNTINIDATICCQNPSMNPMQIVGAITRYLPELSPDHANCARQEIYAANGEIFR